MFVRRLGARLLPTVQSSAQDRALGAYYTLHTTQLYCTLLEPVRDVIELI